MYTLNISGEEYWNEKTEEFVYGKDAVLTLEHSLVSLRKWEAQWNIPFLSKNEKTYEQSVSYICHMTLTQNVDPAVYSRVTSRHIRQVNDYMNLPMTATTFHIREDQRPSREIITAEIIYYWMISLGIPMECQKWHLNQLFTLIRVCSIKNNPGKKMSKRDILSSNAALNAARRRQFNSSG